MTTARLFLERFAGRADVFAQRWAGKGGGYSPVWQTITPKILEDHLAGRRTVGVYNLLPEGAVRFVAFDFDGKLPPKQDAKATDEQRARRVEEARLEALRVEVASRSFGCPLLLERSRGGKGWHLWGFFASPFDAGLARRFAKGILRKACVDPSTEIFPKQASAGHTRKGIGNLIALPLNGKEAVGEGRTAFYDPALSPLTPYPDQVDALAAFPFLDPEKVTAIARAEPAEAVGSSRSDADRQKTEKAVKNALGRQTPTKPELAFVMSRAPLRRIWEDIEGAFLPGNDDGDTDRSQSRRDFHFGIQLMRAGVREEEELAHFLLCLPASKASRAPAKYLETTVNALLAKFDPKKTGTGVGSGKSERLNPDEPWIEAVARLLPQVPELDHSETTLLAEIYKVAPPQTPTKKESAFLLECADKARENWRATGDVCEPRHPLRVRENHLRRSAACCRMVSIDECPNGEPLGMRRLASERALCWHCRLSRVGIIAEMCRCEWEEADDYVICWFEHAGTPATLRAKTYDAMRSLYRRGLGRDYRSVSTPRGRLVVTRDAGAGHALESKGWHVEHGLTRERALDAVVSAYLHRTLYLNAFIAAENPSLASNAWLEGVRECTGSRAKDALYWPKAIEVTRGCSSGSYLHAETGRLKCKCECHPASILSTLVWEETGELIGFKAGRERWRIKDAMKCAERTKIEARGFAPGEREPSRMRC